MAGKVKHMSTIKQLLRLHLDGVSNRQISKLLSLDKGTVNRYIQKVLSHRLSVQELLDLDDLVLAKQFSAGSPAYSDERFDVFRSRVDYWLCELQRKHVTRHLLWREYKLDYPAGYGYSQFCYHLSQFELAKKPTAVLTHTPGERLYLDFAGDTMHYTDPETGEMIKVYVFVATLPFSDYTFTIAVERQTTDHFIYALQSCLEHLGGVPKILVPDNLKAAVIKADRYEPELNRVLEDFANHYRCVVIPTRVARPRDKAMVESAVNRVYQRVYAALRNQQFFSLEELNQALQEKTLLHNQTRMQQKPYSREEKYLSYERATLGELPCEPFQIKYYCQLKVANNNCVYLARDKHYYSVPYQYIGQKSSVIYTRELIKIYVHQQLVATHKRSYRPGYSTVKDHLCSTHRHYLERSPAYYIRMAGRRSADLEALFKSLFAADEVPELLYRRCDGLLSLQRKCNPADFNAACRMAVEHNILTLKFIRKTLENKSFTIEQSPEIKPLPVHENLRGKQYYIDLLNHQF